MDEETKRLWDVRLNVLAPVLTVAGLLIGMGQFNAGEANRRALDRESAIQKDDIEFRRRLWLERLETYRKVAELAGRIAVAPDAHHRQQSILDFEAAYWGTMVLVEDPAVEKAMINFHVELEDFRSGLQSDPARLKLRAEALAAACRLSLEAGELKNLTPRAALATK